MTAGILTSLDDVFRLGEDNASNARRGVLERINMRSIQLRHENGGLHTISLGELGAVTNHSRRLIRMVHTVSLDVLPSQADLAPLSRRATEVLHSQPAFHNAAMGDVLLETTAPAETGSGSFALSFSLIAIKAAGLWEQVQRLLKEVIRDSAYPHSLGP